MFLRIACTIVLLTPAVALAARNDREERDRLAAQLLREDRLITIRIRMSARQWQMMQPERASRLAVALGVPQRPATQPSTQPSTQALTYKSVEGERRIAGLVGNEYAYVRAQVDIDGHHCNDVGVRFKGQWSYTISANSPRRPLKLKFDEFIDDAHYSGVESLSLNTNAVDPSQLRESLAYAAFREAGIPASRTCLALVYLHVEGVYDNEFLGIYTAIEEVDKDFLRRHFGTSKGLLIRPERTRNLAYLGEKWEDYNRYNLQTPATPFTSKRFIDFTRLVNLASDEEFAPDIRNFLDEDFLRFLAANVLIINLDSFLVNGHNYYIYVHPGTGKLHFIPWDLHLSYGWYGKTIEEWVALTIDRPYRESNRLAERILAVPALRDAYRAHLREFATGFFTADRMHPRIDRLNTIVEQAHALARAAGKELPMSWPAGYTQQRAELKPFVVGRAQHVLDQLDGKVEGDPVGGRRSPPKAPVVVPPKPPHKHVPPVQPPVPPKKERKPDVPRVVKPPVPPKPRPVPPHPLTQLLSRNLDTDRDNLLSRDELLDATRHLAIAHAMVHAGPITEPSLAETFDRLGTLLNPYPAAPEENAAVAPPSTPSAVWAKALLPLASSESRATPDQFLAAARKAFDDADANRNNTLSADELTAWLDRLVPRQ